MVRKLWLVVGCLLLGTMVTVAQDDASTQTRTYEGVSVTIPDGWLGEEIDDGGYAIYSSEAAAGTIDGDAVPEGDIFMLMQPPGVGFNEGNEDFTFEEWAPIVFEVEDTVESYEALDYPALYLDIGEALLPSNARLILVDIDGVEVLFIVLTSGDFADIESTVVPILNSVSTPDAEQNVDESDAEIRQWASTAEATSQYGEDSWSAMQATGEPDTDACGDIPTAWASESSTGEDVLLLTYDEAVIPTEVNIYQTYNPGSITRVELALSTEESTYVIPDSTDAPGNTDCPGVFSPTATGVDTPVDTVIIYLDQSIGGDWNEIDAVELVGLPPQADPESQWASAAEATSQYGEDSWSAMQATGEPDTDECGDIPTAWASESSTGEDVLLLTYDDAVIPTEVNIYQTYNPGSITRVELALSTEESTYVIPDSADTPGNTECPGVFSLDTSDIDVAVDTVIIYLDQSIGGNWNEIDAVELIGIPQS